MSQESDETYNNPSDYVIPILYTLICIIGIIGNGLVIYVILYTSSLDAAKLYKKRNSRQDVKSMKKNNKNGDNSNGVNNKLSITTHENLRKLNNQSNHLSDFEVKKSLLTPRDRDQITDVKIEYEEVVILSPTIVNDNAENSIEDNDEKINKQSQNVLFNETNLNENDRCNKKNSLSTPLNQQQKNINCIKLSQIAINNNGSKNFKSKLPYLSSIYERIRKMVFKSKLSVTNFYLINLAFADLIFLLFIPFLIATSILKRWIFGVILCRIYFSIVYICQFNTAFIICILSFDRWIAVKFPLKVNNFRNLFVARVIIFISWLLSITFTLPVIMHTNQTVYNSTQTSNNFNMSFINNDKQHQEMIVASCHLDWPDSWNNIIKSISPVQAFQFYTLIFNYLIPVTFIIAFYIQVLRKINQKGCNLIKSKNRLKSYRKITRMVLAVIGCYVICWTPYWTLQMVITIFEDSNDIIIFVSNLTQLIAYLNSALNPILYSYLSENFRSNLKLTFLNTICC